MKFHATALKSVEGSSLPGMRSHKASPGVAWLLKIYGPGWVGKVGYWSTVFRHDNTPSTRRKQSGPDKGRNQGMSDLWEGSAISLRVPYWH